jgi:D-alanyl-D-alanine carboxypeptidase (penicillin-binding protein 5/6)
MNAKAKSIGMKNTRFINATGLPDRTGRKPKPYSTAYDLTRLMSYALRDKRVDSIMGITTTTIKGSDDKMIPLKSHNKMLWRVPKFVKGKTGWTFASRHTFVGTNYHANKDIVFAMLSSKKPWVDIERLASFGLILKRRG